MVDHLNFQSDCYFFKFNPTFPKAHGEKEEKLYKGEKMAWKNFLKKLESRFYLKRGEMETIAIFRPFYPQMFNVGHSIGLLWSPSSFSFQNDGGFGCQVKTHFRNIFVRFLLCWGKVD